MSIHDLASMTFADTRGETSEGYMTCTNQFIEQNSAELIHYFSLAAVRMLSLFFCTLFNSL